MRTAGCPAAPVTTAQNNHYSPSRRYGAERLVMNRTSKLLFAAMALAACALTFANWSGGEGKATAAPATAQAGPQLYELRIYTAAPCRMDALNERFRDHTLRLFEKHGIKSVGYWTGVDEAQRDKLYYLVAYPDREAREQRLVNGIAKDPEFLKAVAESERYGKLTTSVESVLLSPTDYSPIR